MPIVEVHLLSGYSEEARTRLGQAITDAVRMVVPADPDLVTVMMHEHGPGNYLRGGMARSGAEELPDPVAVVQGFLAAMEARELEVARSYLGPGFSMTFPGPTHMTTLEELIAWAKPRYQRVAKTYDGFDVAGSPSGTTVICRGTLHGVWPDGTAFEGIRFIDRFEVQHGKITRQDVWNDLAEVRP